ncbi:tRNA (adenosine(37)-N6)-threonylcarbamoyltransferase complex ATPase subunit type 1 TsaE [Flavobacterium sp. NST-5]|uniref:tRNA threonylcarbamoyladenosine biosynthesis protein TsaE n=1 Tax=Flavobacterium ichthyis TaxID=2698827 RepID=A0ABW9Z8I5_9FLAO|nr:tRNA (adenosine(37)-N6)-threonylcarbamoyltransferase complex ATPase subunit type 1 TsaE [Flavobacterium ichthyis]NBL65163.1 tRNA (adenosine(37)-N6)-threonylcarbamoyltransferase complex ATPase subunit type 1 TsaE [Flavobacterium ichthyis]
MEILFNLDEIEQIAQKVLNENPHKIILFNGKMGAGKTTVIKALVKALGVTETTSSPTFSLVNEYRSIHNQTIYHFDVYRLNSETEAYDMGLDEYLDSGNWCFIEWAEKIPNLIPDQHSVINISETQNGVRKLVLQ